ncbi:Peptidoglycan/LPS O-acetylase OafA/YrhL, contains acyltransferase and SGNH-hydrolase domains [Granulicella pectinivorans]|uniref:Peptidoglycan/LPS O-acetylase OafA/YrhL, contains acyltransferase and SGNH-hydrolase domains n=1 Tax=Granulicella pectinivorans TaxID=474950 RepID=A0A1I6MML3_9BACT|nr:acyltransferase [Granulicella pectinivorans]SFS16956.1 Peptidoglycan/LPS O-acetylase OafA/YrhL, contains acyltransferase and SGNH-hydrolase domains [Granulicella pectinivorans]
MEKPNLDLLRTIAVTLVVADHVLVYKGLKGYNIGLFGVYIFFVHTCLVLMWSLERNPHTLNFYIRRIFRIYPFAMLIILATFLLGFPPDRGDEVNYIPLVRGSLKGLFENLALIQNLRGGRSIAGVTWSLPMELDMYVFLPMLFAFTARELAIWPLLIMWVLSVSLLNGMYPGQQGNFFAVLIPDFLPGVIAYVGFRLRRPILPAALLPLLVAVLCCVFVLFPKHRVDWWTSLALGLSLPFFHQIRYGAVQKISKIVAKYSYGVYLTHPFGIFFGIHLLKGYSAWLQIPVLLASVAIMSFAGYHLIEEPFINMGKRMAFRLERRAGVDDLDART